MINLKYATAHKHQIPMDIQIVLPPHLSIPDHLLCSLVANLLDNAIEASIKIKDPKIVIEMKMVKDYLSLTIRNKMNPSMQNTALTIRTTKADKKQHGLGRQIIDDIVLRYNGISIKEIKDGWYIASVMLELGAE
ncbi:MAG: GHKL domain-containing protein [Lachnospiraceae bacterium]|nr:GHKL domain-containing protein [Lachnospiraceae bacterium]